MNLLEAAGKVLSEAGQPLHVKEITRRIVAAGLWTPETETPSSSVGAAIYVAIKKGKTDIVRTDKGTFSLGLSSTKPQMAIPSAKGGKTGYVYILVNKAMKGLVKIGMTSGDPKRRARELSTTGLPFPFKVHAALRTEKYAAVEELVHKILTKLTKKRVNEKREFYKIKPDEALEILQDVSLVLDSDDRTIFVAEPGEGKAAPKGGFRTPRPEKVRWSGKTDLAKLIARRGGNEGAYGGILHFFSGKRRCAKNGKWRRALEQAGIEFDASDHVVNWSKAHNPL